MQVFLLGMAYRLFLLKPISDIRYIGSTSPNRYLISDILAQPISDIRYFTDIPVLHHDILSQILKYIYMYK